MAKMNFIQGYTIYNSRKLLKYLFPSEFIKAEVNEENRTFDVSLHKPKNPEDLASLEEAIREFLNYWSKSYRFFLIDSV